MKTANKISLAAIITGSVFMIAAIETGYAATTNQENCQTCHRDLYSDNLHKQSVHEPFVNGNCSFCHVVGNNTENEIKTGNESNHKSSETSKIAWLKKSSTPADTHWFALPANRINGSILVATQGNAKTKSTLEISLPKTIKTIINTKTPPAINNVETVDIQKGIFVSATVTWKTDIISDSTITFDDGTKKASSYNSQLTKNHSITLIGLKPDHKYTYTVNSKDIFDNIAKSETFSFSTEDARIAQSGLNMLPENQGKVTLSSEIYAVNNSYIVKISSDTPTLVAVGTDANKTRKNHKKNNNTTGSASNHGTMKIKIDQAVSLCLNCHTDHKGTGNHPVNVLPKSGMIIPADYPTSPAGKITCLTCHNAHASDLKFRLRKSHKRELCIGCHRDKDTGRTPSQLMVNITDRTSNNS